jgi:thioredoxin 2
VAGPPRRYHRGVTTTEPTADRVELTTCPHCGARNRLPVAATGVPRCGRCRQTLPWIATATDADFDAVALAAKLPVLVDLWAPWCGPCRIVEPGVQKVAKEFAGRLKVVKVNVDDAPRTAQRYQAMSIPMLLWITDGQVRRSQVGALPPAALQEWVTAAL